MDKQFKQRDKAISRAPLGLFWQSIWADGGKLYFVGWLLTRPLALLLYYVLIPFQVAYALQAIISGRFETLSGHLYAIVALGLVHAILWGVGGVFICKNGEIGTKAIQKRVYQTLLEKDYEFYNSSYIGTLGSYAVVLRTAYNEFCTMVMNGVVRQTITVVASIAIIFWHSPLLAVITLGMMLAILSFTILTSRWRFTFRRKLSEASAEIAGRISDALSHGTTVKSFAAESYELEYLKPALTRLGRTQYWSWMSSIPADIGRLLLAMIATVVLLLFTANQYENREISIAIVVLVQLYVVRLIASTQEIAELLKTYETIMGAAYKAVKTIGIEQSIKDPANPIAVDTLKPLDIEFRNVEFSYSDKPDAKHVISTLNLTVKEGEKIGVVGYSGAGKTTVTKLLLRFIDVSAGSILVGGQNVRDFAQADLRSLIAYVPQEPLLFHRTIAENIQYGNPNASRNEVEEAGKAAFVDEFIMTMPDQYDTFVGERGIKLSGGQRQRVAVARAILKSAPILVLDEATSALDSRSEEYIQKALWNLMQDKTVLVIAHRLSTLRRMDRIIVMDDGQIVASGTHKELLADTDGIYAKLWGHQSGGYLQSTADAE